MSQPPKSTMRAPAATWVSASGVRFREADMDRLRCGGIARVTEYAGLPEGPGSGWISAPLSFCLRVAPRVIRRFAPSAPGPRTILPARQVSPECCFSLMAGGPWLMQRGMGYLSDSGRIAPSAAAVETTAALSRDLHDSGLKHTSKARPGKAALRGPARAATAATPERADCAASIPTYPT